MNARTALVTGSSSGIGRATALELDRLGFTVYAGVRRQSDAEELKANASPRLTPLILDVTKPDQIAAANEQLTRLHRAQGIDALVNVAGVADFGPIETLSIERLRQIFDVNFFGAVAITQSMIPLLRKSRGRILNVGSVGAHTTIPFGFTICSSKHALESLTSGLRSELKPWGIDVIAVDPSSIATHAADQMLEQANTLINDTFTEADRDHYETNLLSMASSMRKQELSGMPPEGVATVIARALTARRPKSRYPVGPHARMLVRLSGLLPDRLFDRLKLRVVGIRMTSKP
ncbi:MAG: SDR family NAD(P)-dependent oxidoreductase [Actinomycetota bacterium]